VNAVCARDSRTAHLSVGTPASRAAILVEDRAGCRRDDLERGRPSTRFRTRGVDLVASARRVISDAPS
jgi:hypothetical protein